MRPVKTGLDGPYLFSYKSSLYIPELPQIIILKSHREEVLRRDAE